MNISSFLSVVSIVVGADILAYPQLQEQALETQVEGDVRHAIRVTLGNAGFLVDLLWNEPQVHALILSAIQNAISQAQAQPDTTPQAPPTPSSGTAPATPAPAMPAPPSSAIGTAMSADSAQAALASPQASLSTSQAAPEPDLTMLPYVTFIA